jgi:hypothetical protein
MEHLNTDLRYIKQSATLAGETVPKRRPWYRKNVAVCPDF